MRIAIFGLSVSSAWGNGHATLHRGLLRALKRMGHEVHFFERDVPYYAAHRDAPTLPYADLHLYADWSDIIPDVRHVLSQSDVALVTSYCPDSSAACELIFDCSPPLRTVFYDMDTPVTLDKLNRCEAVPYIPTAGLGAFDLVLSYTGGSALAELRNGLGARYAATLYGWVDPLIHHQVPARAEFECDLSYLGTYSADRQDLLEMLMIRPAERLSVKQFVIAGAMYPDTNHWPTNIRHFTHLAPPDHSAFYSSAPLTLSVTRGVMAAMGFCPSGRLFEAAACGTAVLSDWWEGLDAFFEPVSEIIIAESSAEAEQILSKDSGYLREIGARAKERALDCHTAQKRARRLIGLIEAPCDDDDAIEESPNSSGIEQAEIITSRARECGA
jgi:spore maturation protein CgeB